MPVNIIPPSKWTGRSDPEDGEHALRLHDLVSNDASRAILGFASDAGVARNKGRQGAHDGPAALRKALANLAAPEKPLSFADLGNVEVTGDDLEDGQAALADKIGEAFSSHERLVVLGGGHEIAFGSYSGLLQKHPGAKIGIINLDAHLDLRLVGENGPSSGTPFTQIRDLNPDGFDYLCIGLAEESNTAALLNRANEWDVQIVFDHALIDNRNAANEAIDAIIARNDIIYLTVCLDVLPHYQAPGVSAPAARGVPLSVIEHLIARVLIQCGAATKPIPLIDFAELSPPHDRDGVTARCAALLARRVLVCR